MTLRTTAQRLLGSMEPGNVGVQIVSFVVAFPFSLAVARYLGPAGRGIYGLTAMTAAIVALMAGLGMAEAVPTILARHGRDEGAEGILARTVFWSTGLCALLFVAVAPTVFRLIDIAPTIPLVAGGTFLVVVLALWPFWLNVGTLQARVKLPIMAEALRLFVYVFAALVAMTTGILTATVAVFAFGISYLVAMFVVIYRIRPRMTRPSVATERKVRKEALFLGWRATVARLLEYGASRLDIMLVGGILGVGAAGIWVVTVKVAELLLMAANANVPAVLHGVAVRGSEGKNWGRFLVQRVAASTALAAFGAVGIVLFGGWLIDFALGAAYLPAAAPLRTLSLAAVLMTASRLLRHANFALGRMRANWMADAITALIIVTGNLAFLETGGLTAAARVSVAANTGGALILAFGLVHSACNPTQQPELLTPVSKGPVTP